MTSIADCLVNLPLSIQPSKSPEFNTLMIICLDSFPRRDVNKKTEIKFTVEYLQKTKVLLTVWSRMSSKSATEIVANREAAIIAVILEIEEVMKDSPSNAVV